MDIIAEVVEIKTKLHRISDVVAAEAFGETLKAQQAGYLIDKIKGIKTQADDLVKQIRHRAKEGA